VKPSGFLISEKARAFHGISNEEANSNGMDLAAVLKEFMDDVRSVCARSGRVCAHNFEFDSGIILEELQRCGLLELQKEWMTVARNKSYCTMNPNAGRWITECTGADVGPTTKQQALGLDALLKISGFLGTERSCFLRDKIKRHRAQFDAEISYSVYAALLKHAGVPANGTPDAQVREEDDTQEYDADMISFVDNCCEETPATINSKTARMQWELRFAKTLPLPRGGD
jgi:DNA polymerase III epsilon subunit-like protein